MWITLWWTWLAKSKRLILRQDWLSFGGRDYSCFGWTYIWPRRGAKHVQEAYEDMNMVTWLLHEANFVFQVATIKSGYQES
ncbi:hypothetical protein SERLA73DRAFT_179421 [Serpula lacrymans var. lacrymans S7.3]|uniref:Uncharacterized protein n=2 Tax=Serpula lacrymans var. lacrymans TaxID=341189 RepID=F8PSE5_SERL3|nr:uncharacterized protein SERLADRAFT_464532 [Serpula lacrymans var. lacrymans S7.9]EGO01275.1 hypothetical protein SERLA73DRAFT_179421 [Serpula lacrymans var. lacrymans S7.3]EGO26915.1 hypothetical protein SERLADRAFT_464532 [Serpula lacrymans var. lacrymans S7.9]